MTDHCFNCGSTNKIFNCGGCKQFFYCSQKCLRNMKVKHYCINYRTESLTKIIEKINAFKQNLQLTISQYDFITKKQKGVLVFLYKNACQFIESNFVQTDFILESDCNDEKLCSKIAKSDPSNSVVVQIIIRLPFKKLAVVKTFVLDNFNLETCEFCKIKTDNIFVCSHCMKTFYCSKLCQYRDWSDHMMNCYR